MLRYPLTQAAGHTRDLLRTVIALQQREIPVIKDDGLFKNRAGTHWPSSITSESYEENGKRYVRLVNLYEKDPEGSIDDCEKIYDLVHDLAWEYCDNQPIALTDEMMKAIRPYLREPKRECGWLHIKTAPKDGTLVYLWCNGLCYVDCRFDVINKGWIGGIRVGYRNPTLWMPGPKDPSSIEGGQS
jgi:hypothetical protein